MKKNLFRRRAAKVLCVFVGLGLVVPAEAGTVLVMDGKGNITGSYVDPTTPYSYGKIQTETSGLVYAKMAQRGISTTSTQAATTIEAIETVAVGAANGARSGFGGGWIGTVIGAVIGAVVNAAVAIGLDAFVSWLFGSGNSVTSTTTSATAGPLTPGASYYTANCPGVGALGIGQTYGSTPQMAEEACATEVGAQLQATGTSVANWTAVEVTSSASSCGQSGSWGPGVAPDCLEIISPGFGSQWVPNGSFGTVVQSPSWPGPSCASGGAFANYINNAPGTLTCISGALSQSVTVSGSAPSSGSWSAGSGSTSTSTTTIAAATAAVPSSELSQPINPQLMADSVDALWQEASALPGYSGVPYDPTNPVTSTDATNWQNSNPSYTPEVGDGLGTGSGSGTEGQPGSGGSIGALPINNTPGSSDPTPGVNTGTPTGTGTGTGTSTGASGTTGTGTGTGTSTGASGTSGTDTADLCSEDPTASACAGLGAPPAPGSIPASSVSVGLSPWSIGPASGTCPAPLSVTVFGNALSFSFTPLCTFASEIAPLLIALCALLAAWIVVAGIRS